MSMPEAARLLLTSAFMPGSNSWDTHDEQMALHVASKHQQTAPRPLCDSAFFASHDVFRLPDHAAPTRLQPPGQSSHSGPLSTSVHRFRLTQQLRETLLPALEAAALQQRYYRVNPMLDVDVELDDLR